MTKFILWQKQLVTKPNLYQNSNFDETLMVTKGALLKNSNCDKTQIVA